MAGYHLIAYFHKAEYIFILSNQHKYLSEISLNLNEESVKVNSTKLSLPYYPIEHSYSVILMNFMLKTVIIIDFCDNFSCPIYYSIPVFESQKITKVR